MPLASGSRLGPTTSAPHSMQTASRALQVRDTRLDRTVSIKILPWADPELKARFEREGRSRPSPIRTFGPFMTWDPGRGQAQASR